MWDRYTVVQGGWRQDSDAAGSRASLDAKPKSSPGGKRRIPPAAAGRINALRRRLLRMGDEEGARVLLFGDPLNQFNPRTVRQPFQSVTAHAVQQELITVLDLAQRKNEFVFREISAEAERGRLGLDAAQ